MRPSRTNAVLALVLSLFGCSSEADTSTARAKPIAWSELIPRPLDAEPGSGVLVLSSKLAVSAPAGDAELGRSAELLASALRAATGYAVPVVDATGGSATIALSTLSDLAELGDEGYELSITTSGVEIRAHAPAGVFYGTETLRQLLPAHGPGPWALATGVIRDQPRYAWRGFMVDVARHFFTTDELRRYVDVMAYYKLNRLHVHLTDDQGWRIQIAAWPALTEVGASTEVGGGPGGFYTKQDLVALVSYAADRYVVVVPEIDMPGHVRAALASVPELNCDGIAPPLYTGTSVGISSLCIGTPTTEQFVSDVIGEVAAMTPGPWLHVGGDEAEKTSDADYVSFMTLVRQKVQAQGKTLLGWEEIAKLGLGSGSVAQHWKDSSLALQAATSGADVVLSPASRTYLDMKYDLQSTPGKGTFWAGFVDVRTAYDWDPGAWLAAPAERIAGVEAPVWTETLATTADLDVMVFPRLLGHAELAWSPWQGHDVDGYLVRLGSHGPRLASMGIGFFRAPEVPWAQ